MVLHQRHGARFSTGFCSCFVPLGVTPLYRLKRCQACGQCHSSWVFTLLPVDNVHPVRALKVDAGRVPSLLEGGDVAAVGVELGVDAAAVDADRLFTAAAPAGAEPVGAASMATIVLEDVHVSADGHVRCFGFRQQCRVGSPSLPPPPPPLPLPLPRIIWIQDVAGDQVELLEFK
jgi:hypothetical protein